MRLSRNKEYIFVSDKEQLELRDIVSGSVVSISSPDIFLFDAVHQVRYVKDVITVRPGTQVLCILAEPVILGVPEIYYPEDHTFIHQQHVGIIQSLFNFLSEEECKFLQALLIPINLRNESINSKTTIQLFTNFVKQSLCVFAGSVYESGCMKIKREIALKLVFGVRPIDSLLDIIKNGEKPCVISDGVSISIYTNSSLAAIYNYPN